MYGQNGKVGFCLQKPNLKRFGFSNGKRARNYVGNNN